MSLIFIFEDKQFLRKAPCIIDWAKILANPQSGWEYIYWHYPSWTCEKFSLEILSIHSNEFDGEIPLEFCHLSQLRVLNLAQCRIAATLLRCFSNFSVMIGEARKCEHWLYAGKYDENVLVSWKGRELEYTKTLEFLFSVDISSKNLFWEFPKELTSLAGLQNLNLSGNKFQGVIPLNIGQFE